MRLVSLFLAALLALLPLSALAEEADYPGIVSESYMPESIEKTVFDTDDRQRIYSPTYFPYSAVANLEVEDAYGCRWQGSGFMVAKDCLMTAAHMVVCDAHQQPASKITAYFGFTYYKDYKCKYEMTDPDFWYNPGYYAGPNLCNPEYDYAYVRVPETVGQEVGFFGLSIQSDDDLNGLFAELSGYRNGEFKTALGFLTVRNSKSLTYTIDMEPGNSGCPVFYEEKFFDADGNPVFSVYYVVGINVAEDANQNYACRITQDIFDEMRSHGFFQ